MQPPEQYADREYLSAEEVAENEAQRIEIFEKRVDSGDGVGGYNSFWYESAGIGHNLRTSLITYPVNGRLPPVVEGAYHQVGSLGEDIPGERPLRALFGGLAKDGPEDRGLS